MVLFIIQINKTINARNGKRNCRSLALYINSIFRLPELLSLDPFEHMFCVQMFRHQTDGCFPPSESQIFWPHSKGGRLDWNRQIHSKRREVRNKTGE